MRAAEEAYACGHRQEVEVAFGLVVRVPAFAVLMAEEALKKPFLKLESSWMEVYPFLSQQTN